MKPHAIRILFILILFIFVPIVSADTISWDIGNSNGTYTALIANTSYVPNEGYVAIQIWAVLVIIAFVFLLISLLVKRAGFITAIIAFLLFGLAAYMSLVLTIPSDINMATSSNSTVIGDAINVGFVNVLQPAVYYIGNVWLSILMIGLAIIAALKAVLAYSDMLLKAGEEAETRLEVGRKIQTTEAPNMRDIARGRFGVRGNKR